jgi:hypothetical protein
LTLLAPDIVEAILEGMPPKAMQLEEVTRKMPSGWDEFRLRPGHFPSRMPDFSCKDMPSHAPVHQSRTTARLSYNANRFRDRKF